MGSGASKKNKVITNVDVQLSSEEKQRFVDSLKQQIQEEHNQQQQQQVLQLQQKQQILEKQNKELELLLEKQQHITSKRNTDTRATQTGEEDEDSDYVSEPEDDEQESTICTNEDIDYQFLDRVVLATHEAVDSDDECDETSSSISYQESVDEGIVEEIEVNGKTVQQMKFQANYAEFPSHKSLRQENIRYWNWKEKFSVKFEDPNGPEPTRLTKADIFQIDKFVEIDKHALEAPRDLLSKSVDEVVKYLIKNCKTELQKARVIFRWCVAQDLNQLPDKSFENSVLQILKNIHNDKDSYGKLYNNMLSLAGLKCKELRGAVKAATYKLGESIDFDSAGNEWTAVMIDNVWRLVDLHFAARKQTGGSYGEWELIDDNGKGYTKVEDAPVGLSYSCDEFYFLTDPEEFVYNHYPNDDQWQLLARTITKDEFRDMAYLRSSFFELDMDVRAARRCVMHAPSGESIIKFGLPKGKKSRYMYKLWKSNKDGVTADTIQGQHLSQFVYMEMKEGILICKVSFPISGKYKFQLFGRFIDKDSADQSYSWAADYLIMCTKGKENFIAMPSNSRQEWGPGHDVTELGMRPITHGGGVIETEDGHVEVKFEMKQPVEILAKLRGEGKTAEELDEWVVHREENGEVVINLRIQEKGTYALDLFAKEKDKDGSFPHICTYLINAADGVMNELKFPKIANQKAGPTSSCKQLTLVPISHKDSYFTSENGQEDIIFEYSMPLIFTTNLYHQTKDSSSKIENHVFIQQTEKQVTFKTRFPKSGIYLMNIYAKLRDSEESYPNVYNYVIYVPKPMDSCMPFPKTYSQWGQGCEVQGLEEGIVGSGEELKVKAKIPGAKGVALIGNGEWTYLQQNEEGEWTGNVKTAESEHNMKLSARFDESNTYTTLAEYEVKTKEQISAIEEEQNEEAEKGEERKKQEEELKKKKEEEFKKIKKELEHAIKSKDITKLRAAVKNVEGHSYTSRLKEDYNTARNLIKSLERIARLQKTILKMNQATMAEIRSYPQPPKAVHEVMIAAFLTMQYNETITKEWKKCQALGNSNNLKKSVKKFNVHDLNPEIAARAKKILQRFRLEDVASISSGAACFYAWTLGMAEELNILKKGSVKKAKPADIKRQKELFGIKAIN